ncbi:hypothetical protein C2L64_46190 [Paraburkholderia hospita]|uniref:Plasmid pRiA4b Orf3-like domain-containing protein n=1 Tax=Paraburkholderia hospita TaxID=169430 RepID=A0AAN1JLX2_9BURK|nr:hypothetical protein C2L64_46190 [Paraburkholderia hospita]
MDEEPGVGIYRLHVWLRQISPMIWRRLLVRSDSTITDLHHILQIAFGWNGTSVSDTQVDHSTAMRKYRRVIGCQTADCHPRDRTTLSA